MYERAINEDGAKSQFYSFKKNEKKTRKFVRYLFFYSRCIVKCFVALPHAAVG